MGLSRRQVVLAWAATLLLLLAALTVLLVTKPWLPAPPPDPPAPPPGPARPSAARLRGRQAEHRVGRVISGNRAARRKLDTVVEQALEKTRGRGGRRGRGRVRARDGTRGGAERRARWQEKRLRRLHRDQAEYRAWRAAQLARPRVGPGTEAALDSLWRDLFGREPK